MLYYNQDLLFNVFLIFGIFSAVCIFLSKNPVYSLLFLILTLFFSSMSLITIGIDYMGIIFMIIYVGAIAVLFLFVIMTLNIKKHPLKSMSCFFMLLSTFLFSVLSLGTFCNTRYLHNLFNWDQREHLFSYSNIETLLLPAVWQFNSIDIIGLFLYTQYTLVFLLCGFILLIAMIGSIVITADTRSLGLKQNEFTQSTRCYTSCIILHTK